ncbi:DUF397 domain-containing protein [Streptomyces clavuligerus]|uniref:DUF397 domain-containing protein n=1 Tax=Streptomyces clavuligerus TaxID=1901 RepID=B5H2W4_STRCL|nr:DUF397 domain-containing protein [Streptomyces clavuligerus]ANW18529.1 DUF397 domain-containing protein [Streptomyces clavuligerus]AXU13088.1 DUF397 domain-containing protein [Streptomyces clavuligerus]EDY52910.1 hypothetical protein SSCG_05963 [Streptomyces clavuligerus]EFG08823.1 DUF397 domain-containing protein [Streptomyces clavuligerus]MBY6303025.1 DUF397 domain-containing protein [Streptomyces clavuligerus]
MTQSDWHISSYSGSNDNCVEVKVSGQGLPGVVRVRDSKDRDRPEIQAQAGAWSAFVAQVDSL